MTKYTYFAIDESNESLLAESNFKDAKSKAKMMGCDLFRQEKGSEDKECVWANPELEID